MMMMVKSDCSSLVILIFIENMVSHSSLEGTYTVATRRIRAYKMDKNWGISRITEFMVDMSICFSITRELWSYEL